MVVCGRVVVCVCVSEESVCVRNCESEKDIIKWNSNHWNLLKCKLIQISRSNGGSKVNQAFSFHYLLLLPHKNPTKLLKRVP